MALEDECASLPGAIIYAAFQEATHLRAAPRRWVGFAKDATFCAAFARPEWGRRSADATIRHIGLPETSPLAREWAVVVDGTESPAVLAAAEQPGPAEQADFERQFAAVVSFDPAVVRAATHAATAAAVYYGHPDAGTALLHLEQQRPHLRPDADRFRRLHDRANLYALRLRRPTTTRDAIWAAATRVLDAGWEIAARIGHIEAAAAPLPAQRCVYSPRPAVIRWQRRGGQTRGIYSPMLESETSVLALLGGEVGGGPVGTCRPGSASAASPGSKASAGVGSASTGAWDSVHRDVDMLDSR